MSASPKGLELRKMSSGEVNIVTGLHVVWQATSMSIAINGLSTFKTLKCMANKMSLNVEKAVSWKNRGTKGLSERSGLCKVPRQTGRQGHSGDKAASAGPMEGRESQVRRISWCPVKPFRHGCKYKDGLK